MTFDFPLILFLIVVISGLISLFDVLFFAKQRRALAARGVPIEMPKITEYARSFFPVLCLVWVIRSFIAQPFVVPSGSLLPTVDLGDFTIVTQYNYGLRFPIWNLKFLNISEPQRGDIMVFNWPVNRHVDLVKRVIGLPGDSISYINKVLYVNGQEMKQHFVKNTVDPSDIVNGVPAPVQEYEENLDGVKHYIFTHPEIPAENFYNLIVPPHEYFAMGDNRGLSDDSRDWGFVPEADLVGKSEFIFFSWDSQNHSVRWDRIGKKL